MSRLDPDELEKLYQDFQNGIARVPSEMFALVGLNGTKALSVTALQNPLTRTGETTRVAIAPAHELFLNDNDESRYSLTHLLTHLTTYSLTHLTTKRYYY